MMGYKGRKGIKSVTGLLMIRVNIVVAATGKGEPDVAAPASGIRLFE